MSDGTLALSMLLFGILLVLMGGFGNLGDKPMLGGLVWLGLLFGVVGLFFAVEESLEAS